jgi:hypothetical protein
LRLHTDEFDSEGLAIYPSDRCQVDLKWHRLIGQFDLELQILASRDWYLALDGAAAQGEVQDTPFPLRRIACESDRTVDGKSWILSVFHADPPSSRQASQFPTFYRELDRIGVLVQSVRAQPSSGIVS